MYQEEQEAQAKTTKLELVDNADVDAAIAAQIQEGLIDAADVAPVTADDLENAPRQVFRRKVIKKVEVPITRKVKVPCMQQKLVEDVEIQKVKTKKQVQKQGVKLVEEAYTEIEEQPATRVREIWVKKLVKEPYMKKVEVRKTRTVEVPCVTTEEIEVEEEVRVPTTRVVDVQAFRVDEIKDTKIVEVEGWQEVELIPRIKDSAIKIERSRDVENKRRILERRIGQARYDEEDQRLDNVDTDSEDEPEEDGMMKYEADVQLDGTETRTKPKGRHRQQSPSAKFVTAPAPATTVLPAVPTPAHATTQQHVYVPQPPAKTVPTPPARATPARAQKPSGMTFGFRLVEKGDKGLLVTQVTEGGFAHMYDIKVSDTIRAVDMKAVSTIRQWRKALSTKQSGAEMMVTVERSSGESINLMITLDNFDPQPYAA
eukprot:NODE_850_length_1595_cov_208.382834_g840_i0.p1 GENE.NODE_850_length_1595_cov_208.382834_g840_i0~~NODE_850_length_1595_cov_208.382834_g840_i0.p1  ORF type:complete len:428 (+),score=109.23 NODE_850_length_1595_cov_208.382834_g840_i0:75-1358(+)